MGTPLRVEELLEHAGWLRRLAMVLVQDPASADDLVQDAWVAALRRPPTRDTRPRSWLARVARNLVRNARRSEARRLIREELAREERSLPGPDSVVEEAETQRLLAEAVTNLDEELRTTIVLRYFRGL